MLTLRPHNERSRRYAPKFPRLKRARLVRRDFSFDPDFHQAFSFEEIRDVTPARSGSDQGR